MTVSVVLPQHEAAVDIAVLAALHRLGGKVEFQRLHNAVPVSKRDLYRSLSRQYGLGNVKRHQLREPIALTSSARIAIEAGMRAAQAVAA